MYSDAPLFGNDSKIVLYLSLLFFLNLYTFSFKRITKFLPRVGPSLFLNFYLAPKVSVKALINQIVNF